MGLDELVQLARVADRVCSGGRGPVCPSVHRPARSWGRRCRPGVSAPGRRRSRGAASSACRSARPRGTSSTCRPRTGRGSRRSGSSSSGRRATRSRRPGPSRSARRAAGCRSCRGHPGRERGLEAGRRRGDVERAADPGEAEDAAAELDVAGGRQEVGQVDEEELAGLGVVERRPVQRHRVRACPKPRTVKYE